jgi:hypothetical protein
MNQIIVLLRGNINYDARVQKEIETLTGMGFGISLIVWNWEVVKYRHENVNIIDINLSDHKVPSNPILTFIRIVRFWHLSARIIRSNSVYCIHCNDLDTLGILFFLNKDYYSKIIYDAHELYPESFTSNSLLNKAKRYVWNAIERLLIKRTRTVIVPEFNRGVYLKGKYNLLKNPYVINNFPRYQNIDMKSVREKFKISSSDILVCYTGVIDWARDIELMIDSFTHLPGEYKFILFGYSYGKYNEHINAYINKRGLLERIFFYGKYDPRELLSLIADCDIGIAFYKNDNLNNYYCAPNKVFDYLMAGLKIITNNYPSLQLLSEYNNEVRLLDAVNPVNLANHIVELSKSRGGVPENVRLRFSWENLKCIFDEIYYNIPEQV